MLCTRCGKYPAVLIINDEKNPEIVKEALCSNCLNEMNSQSMNTLAGMMGMSPEDMQSSMQDTMEIMSNMNLPEDADGEDSEAIPGGVSFMFGFPADKNGNPQNMSSADAKNAMEKFMSMFGMKHTPQQEDAGSSGQDTATKTKSGKDKKKKRKFLDTYGLNLTEKAKNNEIDRVVGRNREIARVIQVLNRRSKNNPVLLGEPGVGKTAIAEGLALRIVEKQVPAKLFNYEIYLIDFAALVAGTQFRGQFESRLKNLLDETKREGNIILVIDEIHNIVGAGDAEGGAMSAANILKPALARGEIQIIGATTLNEYRKKIEKDSALERRFQPVIVDEPTIEESIDILKGIKNYYEDYHKVEIPDEVIKSAVIMSERYIHDRFLPDKAIDIIDEASSKANLENAALTEIATLKSELETLEAQREAVSEDDYQAIADLKSHECRINDRLAELESGNLSPEISSDDVAEVVEMWTRIPVQKLTEVDSKKLLDLEENLHKRVIGQETAVSAVSRAVRRKRAGFDLKKRPISFIFAGPTGVGKTELVKALAECMFGSEEALIRIDMSEYMEKHSVSKLVGSPPGYVGYDEAGQLTEKIRRNPYSIILLDEIEKAHADVFNIFLQVLDDGRITDSQGRVVNFENTVIVMTTNAGSDLKSAAVGFESFSGEGKYEKALSSLFRPEFLNRVDEIIEFTSLSEDELRKIVDLMCSEILGGLSEKGISFEISDAAKGLIVKKGYNPKFGARPLRRVIMKEIEDKIAREIICGSITPGSKLSVDAKDEEFVLTLL